MTRLCAFLRRLFRGTSRCGHYHAPDQHPLDPVREQRRKVHLALGQMRRRRHKRVLRDEDGF